MRTVQSHEAQAILAQLKPHQRGAMQRWSTRFVYASDEMYLLAGQPIPSARAYDGFPQYANGVGTIRAFLDEVARVRRSKVLWNADTLQNAPLIALVTGSLAAPALREMALTLEEKGIARASVIEIENTFWGGNVGCAGLIMGEEILAQMPRDQHFDHIFLPPDAVDNKNRMLDDITLDQLSAQLGAPVRCDATGPLHLAQLLKSVKSLSVA